MLSLMAVASVVALKSRAWKRLSGRRWFPVLAAVVVAANVTSLDYPRIPRERSAVLAAIAAIPSTATIQVMPCFYPVAPSGDRKRLILPGQKPEADYVVLRGESTIWPFKPAEVSALETGALADGYRVSYKAGSFTVLKKEIR